MSGALDHNSLTSASPDVALASAAVVPYEQRLTSNLRWAMDEGDRFFQGKGGAKDALLRIAKQLNELQIPYAVAGGMALNAHGYRRFTEDVDILVTPEDLDRIHELLEGRGYLRPFSRSKNLRDTELGVKIEFLVTGGFPGDGQPKPYAYPAPQDVAVEIEGIHFIGLPTLVELKLAAGMTGHGRLKDLGDVQELIKTLGLSRDFGTQLHAYVQAKYEELWTDVQAAPSEPE